jgi:chloramphenicol 3-O-phosphotransferase
MAAVIWMILAIGTMAAVFAGCVVVVAVGVRVLEDVLAKRRQRQAG